MITVDPYPVKRQEYNNVVGQVRVDNISNILQYFGLSAIKYDSHRNGIDILVYNHSQRLVLVIEVTNWRISDYMSRKKAESIQENFRKYKCYKLIILSFKGNLDNYENYIDSDVDILEIGFQTQPYYWFYQHSIEGVHMLPNGEEARTIELAKIRDYLESKGLINTLS